MSKQGRVFNTDNGWAFDIDVGPDTSGRSRKRQKGFTTKREAIEAMKATQDRYADISDPTKVDVSTYLGTWVHRRAANGAIRATTADSYQRNINLACGQIGHIKLERLTATDLDRFYQYLLTTGGRTGTGRSPRTVLYFHTIIRTALADAVRKGMLSRNVADVADSPSSSSARAPERRIWSAKEVRDFLSDDRLPHYRQIAWTLALSTGLRRGELAALTWSDIKGDQLSVVRTRSTANHEVVEGAPKTARGRRTLTISPDLVLVLKEWKKTQTELLLRSGIRQDYVLTNTTLSPWHPDALTRQWTRDAKEAVADGLVTFYIPLHNCRHWNATQLVAARVDLNTVADRLGHSTPAFTLATYGHSDPERDREAAIALGNALNG